MAKKYYVVKKGLTPGIYLTWADCQKNIKDVSGAVYKGFETIEEAAAFLEGRAPSKSGLGKGEDRQDCPKASDSQAADAPMENPAAAVAYVDGSYYAAAKEYSCGVVIFHKGTTEYFSKKFSDAAGAAMRNVAGEIQGSMCAMQYCLENQIESLDIYYDYEGIEKWCTGAWKANKEGTIAYREFYRKASEKVNIRFVKVKGHSGNKYNDLADKLAKQALGLA